MRITSTLVLVTLAAVALAPSRAVAGPRKVDVVTTLNVLASITREIGGDRVAVTALARPTQDPHTLVAKPTFKAAARKADLFVELGLGLDAWGSAVTDASGNPRIQTGQLLALTNVRCHADDFRVLEILAQPWHDNGRIEATRICQNNGKRHLGSP